MVVVQSSLVSPKGQVVVPVYLRKKYSIKPGEKVWWIDLPSQEGIVVKPQEKGGWRKAKGMLKGLMTMKEFMKTKREELSFEEKKIS